jgi:hypothetical protein
MNPQHLLALVFLSVTSAQAQITTISSPNFGGVTTITPTYQGYSYTTIGGPRSGDFGSVQVTGGNITGVAVGPRGGTYPIVTPAQPVTLPSTPNIEPLVIPSYIPIPSRALVHRPKPQATSAPTPYPKWKAEQETEEFNELFLKVTDRKRFWNDFYRDWKVTPKTPIPLVYMIPYLKLWLDRNSAMVAF